jgi:hypothetical protein
MERGRRVRGVAPGTAEVTAGREEAGLVAGGDRLLPSGSARPKAGRARSSAHGGRQSSPPGRDSGSPSTRTRWRNTNATEPRQARNRPLTCGFITFARPASARSVGRHRLACTTAASGCRVGASSEVDLRRCHDVRRALVVWTRTVRARRTTGPVLPATSHMPRPRRPPATGRGQERAGRAARQRPAGGQPQDRPGDGRDRGGFPGSAEPTACSAPRRRS